MNLSEKSEEIRPLATLALHVHTLQSNRVTTTADGPEGLHSIGKRNYGTLTGLGVI